MHDVTPVADPGEGPGEPGAPSSLFWVKKKKPSREEKLAGQANKTGPTPIKFTITNCRISQSQGLDPPLFTFGWAVFVQRSERASFGLK